MKKIGCVKPGLKTKNHVEAGLKTKNRVKARAKRTEDSKLSEMRQQRSATAESNSGEQQRSATAEDKRALSKLSEMDPFDPERKRVLEGLLERLTLRDVLSLRSAKALLAHVGARNRKLLLSELVALDVEELWTFLVLFNLASQDADNLQDNVILHTGEAESLVELKNATGLLTGSQVKFAMQRLSAVPDASAWFTWDPLSFNEFTLDLDALQLDPRRAESVSKRFKKKESRLDKIWIVPVGASNHWSLAVVVNASHWKNLIPGKTRERTKRIVAEKEKPFIVHFDSCKGTHTAEFVAKGIKELLRYFNQETSEMNCPDIIQPDIPQQGNGFDCGPFTIGVYSKIVNNPGILKSIVSRHEAKISEALLRNDWWSTKTGSQHGVRWWLLDELLSAHVVEHKHVRQYASGALKLMEGFGTEAELFAKCIDDFVVQKQILEEDPQSVPVDDIIEYAAPPLANQPAPQHSPVTVTVNTLERSLKGRGRWVRERQDAWKAAGDRSGEIRWDILPRNLSQLQMGHILQAKDQFASEYELKLAVAELAYFLGDTVGRPSYGSSTGKGEECFVLTPSQTKVRAITVLDKRVRLLKNTLGDRLKVAWEVSYVEVSATKSRGDPSSKLLSLATKRRRTSEANDEVTRPAEKSIKWWEDGALESLADAAVADDQEMKETPSSEGISVVPAAAVSLNGYDSTATLTVEASSAATTATAYAINGESSNRQPRKHSRTGNFAFTAKQLAPILLRRVSERFNLQPTEASRIIRTHLGGDGPSYSLVQSALKHAKDHIKSGIGGRLNVIAKELRKHGHTIEIKVATKEEMRYVVRRNVERDFHNECRKDERSRTFTDADWRRWLSVPENQAMMDSIEKPITGAYFKSMLFIPYEAKKVSSQLTKLYTLDATFSKTKTMYSAYGFTSNGTGSVLGHLLSIENENDDGWDALLQGLRDNHQVDAPGSIFMADQFPGLRNTFYRIFERAKPFWCSWHRADNLAKKGKEIAEKFRAAVNATTEEAVNAILGELTKDQRDIVVWNPLNQKSTAVPKEEQFPACCVARYGACMFGRSTTQLVEAMHFANKEARDDSDCPARWLVTIQRLEEKRRAKNYEAYMAAIDAEAKGLGGRGLTPFAQKIMEARQGRIQHYEIGGKPIHCRKSLTYSVQVAHRLGQPRRVTFKMPQILENETEWYDHSSVSCSCGVPAASGLPCIHVIKAASTIKVDASVFAHEYFHLETWERHSLNPNEYTTRLTLLHASILQKDVDEEQLHVPPLRAPRSGRPTERSRAKSVLKDYAKTRAKKAQQKTKKTLPSTQKEIEYQSRLRENWRDAVGNDRPAPTPFEPLIAQDDAVAKDRNDGPAPTPFEPPIAQEASSSSLLRFRSLSVTEALEFADYVDFDHGYVTAEDNEPSDDAREDTKEEESEDEESEDEEIDDS